MGMYDSVMVPCPQCGTKNEFQSKGGDCSLAEYELADAPADVLLDADRHDGRCHDCGTRYRLVIHKTVSASVEVIGSE